MDNYEVLHRGPLITKVSKAIILLHRRSGTSKDIISLAEWLSDDSYYIAAPQAPNNAWYLYRFIEEEKKNEPFLTSSVEFIIKLIEDTAMHIPQESIFIMGFSQGVCMALEVASRYASKYAGIVAFTGGLIGKEINENKYHGNFEGTKVLISNGDHDPYVPLERSERYQEVMKGAWGSSDIKGLFR